MPGDTLKRKDAPKSSLASSTRNRFKRTKVDIAREIRAQPAHKALNERKELDVAAFVSSHQYEIRALEESITKSKAALSTRAFQQVPRQLRRRTASHNVKKMPKRLRARAGKEMKEDNTPTVTARRRESTGKQRLRRDVARSKVVTNEDGTTKPATDSGKPEVQGEMPVEGAPVIVRKFKKRQLKKSWLPTHMYHTKRAHMTRPLEPLWRFAIPITPTEKGYRTTHRSMTLRGCVAWDMSYISSISASGDRKSLTGLLRCLSVPESQLTGEVGGRWRAGLRTWEGWAHERDNAKAPIAPVTVLWDPQAADNDGLSKLLFRAHPSAHLQLWQEIVKLSKMQCPKLMVEDLRFEMGSIEVAGPASAEALMAVLQPLQPSDRLSALRKHLPAVTNTKSLPANAVLGFSISDPRLRQPHRTVSVPNLDNPHELDILQDLLATWPPDAHSHAHELLSSTARTEFTRSLPSQKSIDRRKSAVPPGSFPPPLPTDPSIPVILYTSQISHSSGISGSWKLLLPWQAVLPVWNCLMHYPLSTGDRPRFGGLREIRQRCFESGTPWFPGDFPNTEAGWTWEAREREAAKKEWEKRPPGRRTNFDALDLGHGVKGEVGGDGWGCNWENLQGAKGDIADPKMAPAKPTTDLVSVSLTLLNGGHASRAARIYRLPLAPAARSAWLAQERRKSKTASVDSKIVNANAGEEEYPTVPGVEDLLGFVTAGNYNLTEGRTTAVGSVVLEMMTGRDVADEYKSITASGPSSGLCILRDAGSTLGRLARWKVVQHAG